jgi:hypothetical protein
VAQPLEKFMADFVRIVLIVHLAAVFTKIDIAGEFAKPGILQ